MRSISNYTGQGNIILRNRQLNFNNLVAVITDSRIQEDTLTLIYYSEETQAAAKAAGISVESNTGNLTFTAASTPSMPIVCDIVLLSANIVNQVANASDIDYDNTDSRLTATDVQGAVDELAESYPADNVMMPDGVTSVEDAVDEVKSGLMNLIVSDIKSSATTQSVAGASDLMFTIDVTKQEYIPIFYTTINTTNSMLVPYYYALNGNTLSVAVHNFDSNAHDGTVSALVLYKHS